MVLSEPFIEGDDWKSFDLVAAVTKIIKQDSGLLQQHSRQGATSNSFTAVESFFFCEIAATGTTHVMCGGVYYHFRELARDSSITHRATSK